MSVLQPWMPGGGGRNGTVGPRSVRESTEAATEAGEGLPLASPHPAQSWVLMSGGQSHSE